MCAVRLDPKLSPGRLPCSPDFIRCFLLPCVLSSVIWDSADNPVISSLRRRLEGVAFPAWKSPPRPYTRARGPERES